MANFYSYCPMVSSQAQEFACKPSELHNANNCNRWKELTLSIHQNWRVHIWQKNKKQGNAKAATHPFSHLWMTRREIKSLQTNRKETCDKTWRKWGMERTDLKLWENRPSQLNIQRDKLSLCTIKYNTIKTYPLL